MRRLLLGVTFLALVLPACAGTERPEGFVERWLVSLNQGSAGRPETYAADDLSELILPGFKTADPGELDVIEVGKATVSDTGLYAFVRIHVERLDGTTFDAAARIDRLDGGDGWHIEELTQPRDALPLPSEGGPAIDSAEALAWLAAIGVAVLLIAFTATLMALVPGERPTA